MKSAIVLLVLSTLGYEASAQVRLATQERELTILPGQSVTLTLTLTNTGRVAVRGIFLLQEVTFELVAQNGPPTAPAVIPGKLMPEADYPEKVIRPGDGISTAITLVYDAKAQDYAFKRLGSYQLSVRKPVAYREDASGALREDSLRTGPIAIAVKEPTGPDKEVWEAIGSSDFARLFDESVDRKTRTGLLAQARAILERHPNSAYSQQLRKLLGATP